MKGVTTLPDRRVISSPQRFKKKHGLNVEQSRKRPCQHLSHFFPNYLPEKKSWGTSKNFEKKNVLYEKGDEITQFDCIYIYIFPFALSRGEGLINGTDTVSQMLLILSFYRTNNRTYAG